MPTDVPQAAAAADRAGWVERTATTPGLFCLAMIAITGLGLWLDRMAGLGLQMLLGLATAGFLLIALRFAPPIERARTAVVVVVATGAEVLGSVWWGVYEYRLGNLPLFVPPGHGLVYLTGYMISRTAWVRAHRRAFIGLAIAGAATWGVLGLVALGRTDVAGAVGAAVLIVFLVRGRAPAVYAGVFVAVAALEIYGTAIGTWYWAEEIPALGLPDGNPPSGAASGYVLFDIAALAFAPAVLRLAVRVRGALRRPPLPAEPVTDRG